MINNDFQQIIDDFDFFDDWEDKYRYVIEEGKKMPVLDESLKVDSNKVCLLYTSDAADEL